MPNVGSRVVAGHLLWIVSYLIIQYYFNNGNEDKENIAFH